MALVIEKGYIDKGSSTEKMIEAFVKAQKLLGLENWGGHFFAKKGDIDLKITLDRKDGRAMIKASEVTRQVIEKALSNKPLDKKGQEALEEKIKEINNQFKEQQGGLLACAKLLIAMQDSEDWKRVPLPEDPEKKYTNWKVFCQDKFTFRIESMETAVSIMRNEKVAPHAEEIGVAKAYLLTRLKDGLTEQDIEDAKNPANSLRALETKWKAEKRIKTRGKSDGASQQTSGGKASGGKGFDLKQAVKSLFEGSEDISYLTGLQDVLNTLYYEIDDIVKALEKKEERAMPERPANGNGKPLVGVEKINT